MEKVPQKITKERLRKHFREVYKLADDQIDVMLKSSAHSLSSFFSRFQDTLKKEDNLEDISKIGHGLKGLLLNLGEKEWADLAREIELSAAEGKRKNYLHLIDIIYKGVEEIMDK